MPLYENGKYHALFIGNMHPVKLMDGNKVVFEPKTVEVSGEMLNVAKTYNDSAWLKINGVTQEIGTGEKSPDNPYVLNSTENFDLVSRAPNILRNSSFESTTYWGQIGASLSVNNNIMTVTGTGSSAAPSLLQNTAIPVALNRKIFVRAKVTIKNSNATLFLLILKNNSYSDISSTAGGIPNPVENQEYNLNAVLTVTSATGTTIMPTIRAYYAGAAAATGAAFEVKEAFAVDMGISEANSSLYNLTATEMNALFPNWSEKAESGITFNHTLRSLPDGTKDYIVIDNVAKTAKLYQNIGEIVLNGSESGWGTIENPHVFQPQIQNVTTNCACQITDTTTLRCNRFVQGYNDSASDETYKVMMWTVNGNLRFTLPLGVYADLNAFKTWLESNNIIVQYKLATPTVTDLSYADILTYYPQTQIYTTAEIQPVLEAKIRTWEV